MRPLVSPLPAVAAGQGPFRVTGLPAGSSASCLSPSGGGPGLFNVPLEADSLQALAVRMHELGHLGLARIGAIPADTLSRLIRARIHNAWIQFGLDVVVNAFMMAKGNSEIAHLELWPGVLPREIPRWLAAMEFLRSEGLSREVQMRMSLLARAQFNLNELRLLCSTARLLRERGARASLLPVKELQRLLQKLQKTFGPDPGEPLHPLLETVAVTAARLGRGRRRSRVSGNSQWGPMALIHPALTLRCAGRRKTGKKLFAGYCGSFRFPHRALLPASDGRAFGLKRRIHGGAILIDCSGSMNMTADQLRSLVSHSPASTIALYAGVPGDASGLLILIANHGRFAEIEEATASFGSGNVVDGPALGWLSRQPAPRIWVSDGHVTGLGDTPGVNLDAETDFLVRRARIQRIASLEEITGKSGPSRRDPELPVSGD